MQRISIYGVLRPNTGYLYHTPSLQGLGDITEEEAGKIIIARVMEGCYNTVSSGKVEVAAVINSSQSTSSMDEDGAP